MIPACELPVIPPAIKLGKWIRCVLQAAAIGLKLNYDGSSIKGRDAAQ